MAAKSEKKEKDTKAGLFIPAGLFLGMAYGFLTNNMPAGLFGGLGLGFLCMALVTLFKK
jgi:hypothetical protein